MTIQNLLKKGFMTCVSNSARNERYIKIEFRELRDAQQMHGALIEIRDSENDDLGDEIAVLSLVRDAGGEDLTVKQIAETLGFEAGKTKTITEYLAQRGLIFQYNDGFKGDLFSSEFPEVVGTYSIGKR